MTRIAFFCVLLTCLGPVLAMAANPLFPGWYADPDILPIGKQYWVYPTYSHRYEEQTFFDAYSSPDLVHWTKHPKVLANPAVKWAKLAMWAPCIVPKDGKFYLFFSANDVHKGQVGGIGVAVADKPEGPFGDYLGKPLVNDIVNGAQPIDQAVFQEPTTKQWYLLYGGWGHCNLAKLSTDFKTLEPFDDGQTFHEITPKGYVEGPMMLFKNNKVYFMWSEGGWTNETYQVAYAIADSVNGPFERIGTVIEKDAKIATGAGHHSILKMPDSDEYYICYHRRPPGETDGNHRVTCIDKMTFNPDGTIAPVKMTNEGPAARTLK